MIAWDFHQKIVYLGMESDKGRLQYVYWSYENIILREVVTWSRDNVIRLHWEGMDKLPK